LIVYGQFSIKTLCEIAEIPRSSYYKWLNRKPSVRDLEFLGLRLNLMILTLSGVFFAFSEYMAVRKVFTENARSATISSYRLTAHFFIITYILCTKFNI